MPGPTETLANTTSAGSLTKQGNGELSSSGTDYRFDGGTFVQAGTLNMYYTHLFSDVTISPGATLNMTGDIIGDVINNGTFDPTELPAYYDAFYDGDIFGDYTQGPDGVLRVWFGLQETKVATPLLTVSGTATLDGQLQLRSTGFIPAGGYLEWILHAHGGVFGQFDGWTTAGSPSPLFITGELRYEPKDVYLLATRVSTQAAMKESGSGDALTFASAGHVDAAFDIADRLVASPASALTTTQRQFLQSSASIQALLDFDQAATTFDSLSGHGHAATVDAVLKRALDAGSQSSMRAASLRPGSPAGRWSSRGGMQAASGGSFAQGGSAGQDRWRAGDVLSGSRVEFNSANLEFDRAGGSALGRSSSWQAYLRQFGDDGLYTLGSVGFSHHQLSLERRIDLGNGPRVVQSQRALDVVNAHLEAGRDIGFGEGKFTAFTSVGAALLRGGEFSEWGNTGFELQASNSLHQRLTGDIGLRYSTARYWGNGQWLRLDLGASYRRLLASTDNAPAAFAGAPGAVFDLLGLPAARGVGAARASFTGGGDRWSWQFVYDNYAGDEATSASVELNFD